MKLWVVAGALALWCAPTAQAAPPNFPDLDFFTPTTDTHLAQYQGGTQQVVKFSTIASRGVVDFGSGVVHAL